MNNKRQDIFVCRIPDKYYKEYCDKRRLIYD